MNEEIEVSSFISEETIVVVDAITKEAAFELMFEKMSKNDNIGDPKEFKEWIIKREKINSTSIGNGIAIPHTRLSSIKDFVIGLLICKEGIDYKDGNDKVKLLFMIAASDKQDKNYIKLLSRLMLRLKDQKLIHQILSFNTSEEVYNIIKKAD